MPTSRTTIYVSGSGLTARTFDPPNQDGVSILTLSTTHDSLRYASQEIGFHIPTWLANRIAEAINAANAEGPPPEPAEEEPAEAPTIEEPQP